MTNTRGQASASHDVLTVSEVADEQTGKWRRPLPNRGAIGPAGQAIEPVDLPPGALNKSMSALSGHAVKVPQEDAQGTGIWPGCHKSLTFVEAGCMVQGKGRKAKHFARKNCALRRCQRWPKLCLGETHAPIIRTYSFLPQGCIVGPSLLPLCLVELPN